LLAQFEYPLPELAVEIEEITVETNNVFEGSFRVRNTGGGRLSGQITSYGACAVFTPAVFEGSARINYRITAADYRAGDVVRTGAVIMSNGGEKYIPVTLTVTAASIQTKEGMAITNMRAFLDYARLYPNQAANLLAAPQFKELLKRNHFEFIDAYEYIVSDTNRQRAAECLLRLSGLKKSAKINVLQKYTEVKLRPFQRETYFGRIPIKMEGWGYIDDNVAVKNFSNWLKPLSTISQAIEESGMFNFSIDPALLKGRFASDTFVFAGSPGAEAVVAVIRQPYIRARANKESYGPGENGIIYITNNTGMDLMLEIQPSQPFVQFEAKGHFIGGYAEIPFQTRLSGFQAMTLKRQPAVVFIDIRAKVRDEPVFRRLSVRIGDFI